MAAMGKHAQASTGTIRALHLTWLACDGLLEHTVRAVRHVPEGAQAARQVARRSLCKEHDAALHEDHRVGNPNPTPDDKRAAHILGSVLGAWAHSAGLHSAALRSATQVPVHTDDAAKPV